MARFHSAHDLAETLNPSAPVFCIRPAAATRAGRWFVDNFPGRTFYAVKANPSRWLLRSLIEGGIENFDVASINEVRLAREMAPAAELAFMHPVKSREAIAEAYFAHGVRTFSLDTLSELKKIREVTGEADDLTLLVRISVSNAMAKISLGSKFGLPEGEYTEVLRATRSYAARFGICFHVGSQTMAPQAYQDALDRCHAAVVEAGVLVDIVDVGGGFPSSYPGMQPPPLPEYVRAISARFKSFPKTAKCELWCEPGRALCAEAASLVVRVECRKGNILYLNDGLYGALYDAGALGWAYPVRLLREDDSELVPFSAYGPTCDDSDYMAGPFYLPGSIEEGDLFEIGMMGAYGSAMVTRFNGFGTHTEITVTDEPMLSMYAGELASGKHEFKRS